MVICLFNQPEIKNTLRNINLKKLLLNELPKESKVIGATSFFFLGYLTQ